jgi:hypothetical protein
MLVIMASRRGMLKASRLSLPIGDEVTDLQSCGKVGEYLDKTYELGALDTGSPNFYERLGWIVWPGPTSVRTEQGVIRTPEEDGNVLVRLTPMSPDFDLTAPISCEWRRGDVWYQSGGRFGPSLTEVVTSTTRTHENTDSLALDYRVSWLTTGVEQLQGGHRVATNLLHFTSQADQCQRLHAQV